MGHFKPNPEQLSITENQLIFRTLINFSKKFTDKSVEEEVILYEKHISS